MCFRLLIKIKRNIFIAINEPNTPIKIKLFTRQDNAKKNKNNIVVLQSIKSIFYHTDKMKILYC